MIDFLSLFFKVAYFPVFILFVLSLIIFFFKRNRFVSRLIKPINSHTLIYFSFFLSLFWILSIVRFFYLASSRYLLPLFPPALFIAAFPLYQFKKKYLFFCLKFFPLLFVLCLISALSFQERKPYLYHIPEVILQKRYYNNRSFNHIYVLGNLGGKINFQCDNPNVTTALSHLKADDDSSTNQLLDYLYSKDNPDQRLINHSSCFIVSTSKSTYIGFVQKWKERFQSTPILIYSFTRKKDKREYYVLNVPSDSPISALPPFAQHNFFKENNILVNPYFIPESIQDNSKVLSFINSKGIPYNPDYPYFPKDWIFYTYSWNETAKPFSFFYNGSHFICSSNGWVGLVNPGTIFKTDNSYFCFFAVNVFKKSYISFFKEYIFRIDEKYFPGPRFYNILLYPGKHYLSFNFSVTDRVFLLNFILQSGSVSFDYIFVVNSNSLKSLDTSY